MDLQLIVAIFLIAFVLFTLFFFRKPQILTFPNESSLIVRGPCFGRVMEAKYEPKNNTFFIAIFLSPFHIHWQLNPIDGTVTNVRYDPTGKYELAYDLNKSQDNEKSITTYVTKNGNFKLHQYQIAGFVARRISTYVKPKEEVVKGQIMGLIRFGSRVDLVIEDGDKFQCKVKVDDVIEGSNTILGRWTTETA